MLLTGNYIVQAVCRTLMHSLWQGLIMAVLAGAVVLFTKRLRPSARYAIFTGLLVCFVVTVALTFSHQLSLLTKKAAIAQSLQPAAATGAGFTFGPIVNIAAKPQSLAQTVVAFFNAHANTIVFGWLLIIAFRCMQMLVGLKGVYTLKSKGLHDAGEYWNNRLKQLAATINVKANIKLWQSVIAKAPMVIGHFKPVILLPAGLITALPQDEIEAILLHELAHIRRKDYLVNMLQNFCEIIFFFNPAVLWLSSLIKDERENCCDDIALNQVKNKKQFIHALISFQEYNIAANKYAPGFPGKKDHLLNRVKRIITNNNKTLTNMEKAFLATGIVLVGFVTLTFAQTKKQIVAPTKQHVNAAEASRAEAGDSMPPPRESDKTGLPPTYTADNMEATDTVPPPPPPPAVDEEDNGRNTLSLTTDYKGKKIRLVEEDGNIIELYINGEKIPAEKYSQYQDIIDGLHEKIKEQRKQFAIQQQQFVKQQELFKEQQLKFQEQQKLFRQQQDAMRMQQDSLNKNVFKGQQEKFKLQMDNYKEQQKQFKLQQGQYKLQKQRYKLMRDSMKLYSGGDYELAEPIAPIAPLEPVSPVLAAGPVTQLAPIPAIAATPAINPVASIKPFAAMEPLKPMIAQPNKTVVGIIDVLEDESIISDENDLSFTLDSNELIVNDVKQPAELHTRLKNKFLKSDKDHVKYMSKGNHKSTSVSINSK